MMEALLVEFSSKESGAYIHETTDEITVKLKDKDGEGYTIRFYREYSDILNGENVEIEMTYPNGNKMGLESIWITTDE